MDLNLKQKKLLKLLSINCRFSNKDIGKSIGLSEDTVKYQIENLINKQKLARFNVQFNHFLIGYKSYHMWIRLEHNTKKELDKLKGIKEVFSINSSFGKFDYQILFLAKSKKEYKDILNKITKKLKIKEYKLAKVVGEYKTFTNVIPPIDAKGQVPKNKKRFEYVLSSKQYSHGGYEQTLEIDSTDKKIIKSLLENPRASFQELEEKSKVNHETIRYRMKKYVSSKFIANFGLIHNFAKYGLYTVYVLLKVKKPNGEKIKEFLQKHNNVFYSAKLEGDFNILTYFLTENPRDLGKMYSEFIALFGNSLEKIELLIWNEIHKYIQFPLQELE